MTVVSHTDEIVITSQAPGTFGPFVLAGGTYGISCSFGSSATISVNRQAPDGTFISTFTLSSSQPYVVVGLAPGSYNVVIGVAASSVAVTKVAPP